MSKIEKRELWMIVIGIGILTTLEIVRIVAGLVFLANK